MCWTASNLIVTSSVDETVKVLTPPSADQKDASQSIKYTLKEHELGVISVSPSSDGSSVVSSCMDGNLRWYDLTTGAIKSTFEAGPVEIWTVAMHPQRSQICATGSHSGHVNIFNLEEKKKVESSRPGQKFTMAVVHRHHPFPSTCMFILVSPAPSWTAPFVDCPGV